MIFNNLSMFSETTGWVIKGNKVLRTVDGGKTWRDVSPYSDNIKGKYADAPIYPYFYSGNTAWISLGFSSKEKQLTLYHTTDGGTRWRKIILPLAKQWENAGRQDISFVTPLNGFLLLSSDPAGGLMSKSIYKTTDGGKKWIRLADITADIKDYTTGIKFISNKTGWITSSYHGTNYILTFKTTDGGYSWKKESLHMLSGCKGYYTNSYPPIFFNKKAKTGVLPIEYVKGNNHFVAPYVTSNGGASWQAVKPPDKLSLSCFDFVTPKHWLAIDANKNELYKTNSSGKGWTKVSRNKIYKDIKMFDFVTSKIGWAVGDNILIRTTDGGKTWAKCHVPGT